MSRRFPQRDPEPGRNGRGSLVRSWDAETNDFAGRPSSSQGVREQAEQILDLLRRRKWIILLTCLVVVVGAALYTYTQVPLYQTSSLVLVDKEKQSTAAVGTGSAAQGSGLLPKGESLQNELIFLRNSQTLRHKAAERLVEAGAADRLLTSTGRSGFDRAWRTVRQLFGAQSRADTDPRQTSGRGSDSTTVAPASIAPMLRGRVRFAPATQDTDVIRISAQDADPELAKHLANAYKEAYIALTRESSRARATASSEFLKKRAAELEQDLQSIEEKIQVFQRRQNAVSLDQKESALTQKIANTESELEQARIEVKMERSSLESLREELNSIRPDQLSDRMSSTVDQEIQALQSKIAELELSKQELLLQSGPSTAADSAQVAQIERRINRLREQISRRSDQFVDEVMAGGLSPEEGAQRVDDLRRRVAEKEIAITGLESRIEVLSDRLQEFETELNAIPEKSMDLAQLMRERKYAEQMYGFVTEQLQQARVREKSELGYASSVAEAGTPGVPIRPRPQRNLVLGLILGLLGGVGLALLRDQLDNRVYKPDQLQELGYHEIGVVPNLTPLIEDQLNGRSVIQQNGRRLASGLVATTKPQSAAAESYRKLRTNIQLGHPDHSCKTILVTSPGSGDGKSLTASNLAIVMAQAGHSTLLIDADLRQPGLHELFGIDQSPGLTEALQDELEEYVMDTPSVDNLCVLPAGTQIENPSEVLGSSRFREFLYRAQEYFDQVIVDSSPVLATTDGPLLSDQCDTTLCVVRGGVTTEAELDRAMQLLGDVGADVAGVVFNGFDVSMAYGYKYRYRHYGQYGPYDDYRALPEDTA